MVHIVKRSLGLAMAGAACALLAACASTSTVTHSAIAPKPTKEYFAEKEYGVKASPRVSTKRSRLTRGGGRYQVGKPYQVRGKWYYPKEEPGYSKTGLASWYGDAFHGRLTANGEIYDMTHLTAAHPTMPLPSYARVTNLDNGASVIVRVNDRGPYAHGRVIDLSRKAAEMLDYKHKGVATVKVDYVGPARLDGQDEAYLVASYQPNGVKMDPASVGQPSGVMLAMNAPQPSPQVSVVSVRRPDGALPGVIRANSYAPANTSPLPVGSVAPAEADAAAPLVLPDTVPAPEFRPDAIAAGQLRAPLLGYAPERMTAGAEAIDRLIRRNDGVLDAASLRAAYVRDGRIENPAYVAAGTFTVEAEARKALATLSRLGRAEIVAAAGAWTVNVHPLPGKSEDALLQALWAKGFADAFTVRE
ncbi:MAG: septal ring lytic transglycosylase RlpA family protein [Brucellaceae bacterium]|nr:septal ring lytic transglycosylase RlpA family protein [Brucellaceae bacterium]